jgi:hypothetical protein
MDLRWPAYITSGLVAAASLAPVTVFRSAESHTSQPRSTASGLHPSQPIRLLQDVERHAAQLRTYRLHGPVPHEPPRNPFRYGQRPVPHVEPAAPVLDETASAPVTEPVASVPPLMLVGMAERTEGDAVVRTAIVSGFGDVHLVGIGDRIANRFTVTAIGADAVELRDDENDTSLRLALEHRR